MRLQKGLCRVLLSLAADALVMCFEEVQMCLCRKQSQGLPRAGMKEQLPRNSWYTKEAGGASQAQGRGPHTPRSKLGCSITERARASSKRKKEKEKEKEKSNPKQQ